MLEKSGDLIPVKAEAVYIPWTKRKSQVLNYLHRGNVTFETHVYDTNVGDISPLWIYFNPERWSVTDLNSKFGIQPQNSEPSPENTESNVEVIDPKTGDLVELRSLCPRLLIYPEKAQDEPFQMTQYQLQVPESNVFGGSDSGSSSSIGRGSRASSPLESEALAASPKKRRLTSPIMESLVVGDKLSEINPLGERLPSLVQQPHQALERFSDFLRPPPATSGPAVSPPSVPIDSFSISTALTGLADQYERYFFMDKTELKLDIAELGVPPLNSVCFTSTTTTTGVSAPASPTVRLATTPTTISKQQQQQQQLPFETMTDSYTFMHETLV